MSLPDSPFSVASLFGQRMLGMLRSENIDNIGIYETECIEIDVLGDSKTSFVSGEVFV